MCFWVSLSNMLTFLQQGSDMVQWLKLPLGFFNDRVAVFCIFVLLEGAVRREGCFKSFVVQAASSD